MRSNFFSPSEIPFPSPPFSFPKSKVSCYVADKAVGFYVKEWVIEQAGGEKEFWDDAATQELQRP